MQAKFIPQNNNIDSNFDSTEATSEDNIFSDQYLETFLSEIVSSIKDLLKDSNSRIDKIASVFGSFSQEVKDMLFCLEDPSSFIPSLTEDSSCPFDLFFS